MASSGVRVNKKQRGNPVLGFIRNVSWQFDDSVLADYQVGRTTGLVYLSLQYHRLHPSYIYDRIRAMGSQTYTIRVLLVQVDVRDGPEQALRELARASIPLNFTMLLAWTNEEAGRYIETLRAFERKPADLIQGRAGETQLERMLDVLTTVPSVNKTDAMMLATNFATMGDTMEARKEDLALCPGLGDLKIKRLLDVFSAPFFVATGEAGEFSD